MLARQVLSSATLPALDFDLYRKNQDKGILHSMNTYLFFFVILLIRFSHFLSAQNEMSPKYELL
jgi:hypothetical protein